MLSSGGGAPVFSSTSINFQILATGSAFEELVGDVVRNPQLAAIAFECDPEADALVVAAGYGNGSYELRYSLRSRGIDQVKCLAPFRLRCTSRFSAC